MKENLLADKSKPWGHIEFIHKDGKKHYFWSYVNKLNGNRLSSFDNEAPYIDKNSKWAKSVFSDIFKKSKVLSYDGNILEK